MLQEIGFAQFFIAASRGARWDSEVIIEDGRAILAEEKVQQTDLNDARQKTWQLFQQSLKPLFSPTRLTHILERYHFELGEIAKEGTLPLSKMMIEKIGAGAAIPLIDDLAELAGRDVRDLTSAEIVHFYNQAQRHAYVVSSQNPLSEVRGGPKAAHEYIIYDTFLQDKKFLSLLNGVQHLDWEGYMERLTMAINGHEIPEGTIIPAPGFPKGSLDFYEVKGIVAGKGLYALALKAVSKKSSLPPLLLFRCTPSSLGALDAVHTWRNGAQKKIGLDGYRACRDALRDMIQELGGEITLGAYSLGGSHAALCLRDNWHMIKKAYFYRSVHSAEGVAEGFAQEINQLPPAYPGPNIFIDRVENDSATYAGERHIGWGITHLGTTVRLRQFDLGMTPKNFGEWFELHSARVLDGDKKYPKRIYFRDELTHELDNRQRGEVIKKYEEMRRSIGDKVLYYVIDFFHRILQFVFQLMGIKIFRSSDAELV